MDTQASRDQSLAFSRDLTFTQQYFTKEVGRLKTESCYVANFIVTGGTADHCDINLWCDQSQQSWHHDDLFFSAFSSATYNWCIFLLLYCCDIPLLNIHFKSIIHTQGLKLISFSEIPYALNTSQEICTLFALCSVLLWFGLMAFIPILQDHLTGTEAITSCQWSNLEEHGYTNPMNSECNVILQSQQNKV